MREKHQKMLLIDLTAGLLRQVSTSLWLSCLWLLFAQDLQLSSQRGCARMGQSWRPGTRQEWFIQL